MNAQQAVKRAQALHTIIPAFNVPYLPMVKPVIEAIKAEDSYAMVQVARLEWEKFEAVSPEAVAEEYFKWYDPAYTLLHLDHVPVIDEDMKQVDAEAIIARALKVGYQSVMLDGSRLPLDENIARTRVVADMAHAAGAAAEAELGAVAGHEAGGIGMSYEELFRTRKGFTKPEEAARFAAESHCDWLSVAVGSVHGAIADGMRDKKKPEARLDIEHINTLRVATNEMPLVLHGGSGINRDCILEAVKSGISKINVGTDVRQAYEASMREANDIPRAQAAVYERTRWYIREFLHTTGNRGRITEE